MSFPIRKRGTCYEQARYMLYDCPAVSQSVIKKAGGTGTPFCISWYPQHASFLASNMMRETWSHAVILNGMFSTEARCIKERSSDLRHSCGALLNATLAPAGALQVFWERSKYSWITKKRRTRGLSHVT